MDINKLGMGHKIAGGAGVLLFLVMLILPWWGIPGDARIPGFDATTNAWEALSFIDLVLFVTLAAAIGAASMVAAGRRLDLPVSPNAIVAALGALSTILVLYRIISPPHDLDVRWGVFVGLILCGAIAYGAYQAMQEEGLTVSGARDQVAGAFSGAGESERQTPGGGSGGTGGTGGTGGSSGGTGGAGGGASGGGTGSGGPPPGGTS